jgi:AcrR family transcriptional regulator
MSVVVATGVGRQTHRARIVEAALGCIGRWGTAKTTLDDVARQAGCSRATVYRMFPGGKDAVLDAVARAEVDRFFVAIAARLEAAESLEELLVAGMCEAGRRIRDHQALQFLVTYEPETIMPRLTFAPADEILRCASEIAAPYLARWLEPVDALRVGAWAARLVLSYSCVPSADVDMADEESVRRLVRRFVLPGLAPLPRGGSPRTLNR